MKTMCKWVKRGVLPTLTHFVVGKTPAQKAQNQPKYNINVIKSPILALKYSINVIISRFTQENAKRKVPPFYFLLFGGFNATKT